MKILSRILMWILRYFGWLQFVGAAIAAFASIWLSAPEVKLFGFEIPKEWLLYAALGGSGLAGILSFLNERVRSKYIKRIEDDHKKETELLRAALYQEKADALRSQLQGMAHNTSLNFGTQERICIYSFLPSQAAFECISRYSDHADYTTFSERKRYPLTEGVIGKVWREARYGGRYQDNSFPDGRVDERAWKEYLKNTYGIRTKVSKNFRMRPRDMYTEIIKDTKGISIAVIVFESERHNHLDANTIRSVYNDNKRNAIVNCLEKLKDAGRAVPPTDEGNSL